MRNKKDERRELRAEFTWVTSIIALVLLVILLFYYQRNQHTVSAPIASPQGTTNSEQMVSTQEPSATPMVEESSMPTAYVNPEGTTVATRILPPKGYQRQAAADGSFAAFLAEFPLKADGEPVLLYNGSPKSNQTVHMAVYDLDLDEKDLQQCADSIIRMYAEYLWSTGQQDRIAYHLTNGFLMEYSQWRDGNRLQVKGNQVSWVKQTGQDTSYECFRKYLISVFTYAGTLSLENESEPVEVDDIQIGDILIKGGSPGHCVLVVDQAVNEEGKSCYLLAQGYMPAQEFHILKNPAHEDNPWYYEEDLAEVVQTPEYQFQQGSIRRPNYSE